MRTTGQIVSNHISQLKAWYYRGKILIYIQSCNSSKGLKQWQIHHKKTSNWKISNNLCMQYCPFYSYFSGGHRVQETWMRGRSDQTCLGEGTHLKATGSKQSLNPITCFPSHCPALKEFWCWAWPEASVETDLTALGRLTTSTPRHRHFFVSCTTSAMCLHSFINKT